MEGVRACKFLSEEGISINMTLVFSINQAILASKAGANWSVHLLAGWMIFQRMGWPW